MEEWNYESFLIYLRQILNKMQKEMNDDLKKFQISSTHVGILMLLKKQNGCSMSELSRVIKVDNALMTRNIKELEKINYVYRNRESEIQRKYHICLTENGMKVANELDKIIEEKQKCLEKLFNEEERAILKKGIDIMVQKFITIEKEEKEC